MLGFVVLVVAGGVTAPRAAPVVAPRVAAAGAGSAAGVPAAAAAPQRELLDKYCVTCHNDRTKAGGLVLTGVNQEQAAASAGTLEKVVRKLKTAQMPPPGAPRPDKAAADAFVASLEGALDQAWKAAPNPGRPVVHRLNRTEYTNAVRDLLAFEVARSLLPPDDPDQYGFDNNAEVLTMSPLLLERYMSAAHKIGRLVLGREVGGKTIQTYIVPRLLEQDDRASEQLPFGSRGGSAFRHNFPADGQYEVSIRLRRNNYEYVRGLAKPHTVEVRLDRAPVKTFVIGGSNPQGVPPASWAGTVYGSPEWERYALEADHGFSIRFAAKAGMRTLGISFVKEAWIPDEVAQPRETGWPLSTDEMFDSNPALESITIEGPFEAAAASDTPSRRRVFTCQPKEPGSEEACAKTILTTVGRRAYRRPLTSDDVQTLMTFYRRGRKGGSFEQGVQTALERILVSPDFLFRVESEPDAVTRGAVYRVSDVDLASRLSFFLWSSIPDDELLDLASRGKLREPGVLDRQVQRMMADSRSKALVENFAGQWLQLRDLRSFIPDADLFPEFDENLRDALLQETELFIDSQIRGDRGVVELLNADYTFMNERLARHYGVPNVYGARFRRVPADTRRGGLLGHASLLTVTSYPNRTSPVLRGKWLLDKMLGTPPPPPPPDVPALKDRGANGLPTSVRELLQEHRKNPVCASCHAKMDPLGFALDHFDAIGAWRTADKGTRIDASGTLPDGSTFDGLPGLRALLVERRAQFVEAVIERLVGYAVGRNVTYSDMPAVRAIARESAPVEHRWSAVILGVVKSAPFQMRRSES